MVAAPFPVFSPAAPNVSDELVDANGEADDERKANGELDDLLAVALPNPPNPLNTLLVAVAAAEPLSGSSDPPLRAPISVRRLATLIVRCFISSSDALRNSPCSSTSSSSSSQFSWFSSFPGRRLADIFPMDSISGSRDAREKWQQSEVSDEHLFYV